MPEHEAGEPSAAPEPPTDYQNDKYPLERELVRLDLIDSDPLNPNVMSDREFNLLVENMREVGWTENMVLWKNPATPGRYTMISGHNRKAGGELLGIERGPAVIITDPKFDQKRAHFQNMRHNLIRGKISAQKFVKMFEQYSGQYSREQLTDLFGFEEQAVLDRLVKETEKSLPKELKKQFKEASSEIKTIDDLAKVLNGLFTKYGDTLPYGYMVVDFGGKESVWLRMHQSDRAAFNKLADRCREGKKSLDGCIRVVLQLIAEGLPQFESAFPLLPEVKTIGAPTEDNEVK